MDSEVKFYVHVDPKTFSLKSISANPSSEDGCTPVEINYELGHAFIAGKENIFAYTAIALKEGGFEIHKRTEIKNLIARLDIDRQIEEITDEVRDAFIRFDIKDGEVELHYDGDAIKSQSYPLKFYFTRFNDLSFLKLAFSLDVNILNTITEQNKLKSWPNPIRIGIKDTYDLSIYGIKGQLSARIRERNVKARTKRI